MSKEIMQMALDALESAADNECAYHWYKNAANELRQALTQPSNKSDCGHKEYKPFCQMCMATKQEPVAWQVMVENEPMKEFSIKDMAHDWAVAEKRNGSKYSYWIRPRYTAPPKQDVSLTDEELNNIREHGNTDWTKRKSLARAIEAKLREKNT